MSMAMDRKRRSARLFFLALPLAFSLGIIGIAINGSLTQREMIRTREEDVLSRMAQLVAVEAYDLFVQIEVFLKTIDLWTASHPGIDPRHDHDFNVLVDSFRASMKGRVDIRAVDSSGGLFYFPSTSSKPLANVKDRAYFTVQNSPSTRGLYFASPVLSRVTGIWGIPISYPLSARPADLSVVFAALELPLLGETFENARPQPDGIISLTTRDGILCARAPFNANTVGKEVFAKGTFDGLKESGVVEYRPEGSDSLVAYRNVERFPFMVFVALPLDVVFAPWVQTVMLYAVGLSAFLVGIIVLSLRGYRLILGIGNISNELENKNELLIQSNATKDTLFSVIAHDLRGPISTMNIYIDGIVRRIDSLEPDELKHHLGLLKKSSDRTSQLLENLLAWATLNRDEFVYKVQPLAVGTIVEQALEPVAASAEAKNISVESKGTLGLSVSCDLESVTLVFRNLLTNALKFTPRGGDVVVEATGTETMVEVRVRDTGVGMDAQTLEGLFKVGTRTRAGTDHERGSGLGLVLCKSFIEANGGTIRVESEVDKGSTFTVCLPRA